MAAYKELSGLVGQKFQTEYLSRKPSKPVIQKSIAKLSKVSKIDFKLKGKSW
jgi:hypothetical protein